MPAFDRSGSEIIPSLSAASSAVQLQEATKVSAVQMPVVDDYTPVADLRDKQKEHFANAFEPVLSTSEVFSTLSFSPKDFSFRWEHSCTLKLRPQRNYLMLLKFGYVLGRTQSPFSDPSRYVTVDTQDRVIYVITL